MKTDRERIFDYLSERYPVANMEKLIRIRACSIHYTEETIPAQAEYVSVDSLSQNGFIWDGSFWSKSYACLGYIFIDTSGKMVVFKTKDASVNEQIDKDLLLIKKEKNNDH